LQYLKQGIITERGATMLIREMLDRGGKPDEIIKRKKLAAISPGEIDVAIEAVIKANKNAVADYLAGKNEALNFLVGQVMKYTRGRAEPKEVRIKLVDKIQALRSDAQ